MLLCTQSILRPSPKFTWNMNTRLRYTQWLINPRCMFNGIFLFRSTLAVSAPRHTLFLIDIYLHVSVFSRICIFKSEQLCSSSVFPTPPQLACQQVVLTGGSTLYLFSDLIHSRILDIRSSWLSEFISACWLLPSSMHPTLYCLLHLNQCQQCAADLQTKLTDLCNLDLTFKGFTT